MRRTHGNTSWTDEQIAELRRLNGEGRSDSQIATAMAKLRPGLTKNGVVSLRHRLGIASRSAKLGGMSFRTKAANARASASRAALKPKAPAAPKLAAKAKPSRPMPVLPYIPAPEPPPPASTWAPLKGTTPRSLIECGPTQCRWPVVGARGETLFCCARQHGEGPYCLAHHRMAYVPPPKRRASA